MTGTQTKMMQNGLPRLESCAWTLQNFMLCIAVVISKEVRISMSEIDKMFCHVMYISDEYLYLFVLF